MNLKKAVFIGVVLTLTYLCLRNSKASKGRTSGLSDGLGINTIRRPVR